MRLRLCDAQWMLSRTLVLWRCLHMQWVVYLLPVLSMHRDDDAMETLQKEACSNQKAC